MEISHKAPSQCFGALCNTGLVTSQYLHTCVTARNDFRRNVQIATILLFSFDTQGELILELTLYNKLSSLFHIRVNSLLGGAVAVCIVHCSLVYLLERSGKVR